MLATITPTSHGWSLWDVCDGMRRYATLCDVMRRSTILSWKQNLRISSNSCVPKTSEITSCSQLKLIFKSVLLSQWKTCASFDRPVRISVGPVPRSDQLIKKIKAVPKDGLMNHSRPPIRRDSQHHINHPAITINHNVDRLKFP
jgi:hypothetical protein